MGKLQVYLDDERPIPPGFDVKVETEHEAIELIKQGNVEFISLDYNLASGCGDGVGVAEFIMKAYEKGELDFVDFHPHTSSYYAWGKIMKLKQQHHKLHDARITVL
jgi:hypothetical protein